ncbi:hypothetical protein GQ600_13899 [Phytophthora cactorum]|nr:hypothetical protein GQ600_13899 [Phytophthora cactorum]
MRFSVFVALLVATFLACCSNFASAESVEDRRLRVEAAPAVNTENKLKTNAALTRAVKAVQTSNGDEQAVRKAMTTFAAAKEGAKVSDEGIAKLSAMMATTVQKNPKSWPRLRKFAKITLGATWRLHGTGVATFVATCISFTSARVWPRSVTSTITATYKAPVNWPRWTSGGYRIPTPKKDRLKGRVRTSKASGVAKTQKLNDAQVKTLTKEVATTVKKDRRTWPVIKKGLKILYGTLLAGLIIVGVDAMLSHDY